MTYEEFVNNFNIVDNALKMRTLIRWNGRDLRKTENLSEHTHLVISCFYEIYEDLLNEKGLAKQLIDVNFYRTIKFALLHDSLELFRGDILSVTKDAIEGLREQIDAEEFEFICSQVGCPTKFEQQLVKLADLKACYKFIERELEFPSNDFAKQAYKETYKRYVTFWNNFCKEYKLIDRIISEDNSSIIRFAKGYKLDAGMDIVLEHDAEFMPHSTCYFDLGIKYVPKKGTMAILAPRSSAAIKGINIASCPIDADYNGTITAIVNNISNQIIRFKRGESFCQIIPIQLAEEGKYNEAVLIKKLGKRNNEKLGSTGR